MRPRDATKPDPFMDGQEASRLKFRCDGQGNGSRGGFTASKEHAEYEIKCLLSCEHRLLGHQRKEVIFL
ncbi:hypothetical protein HPP92_018199 [Vanilla planifolia]|uniref:Uncharacterized protein n=1 Tax=Vanilla planifolia TaxID=51239 RepID=A0A835UML3_VANPL|nr:hypothetical protein HPP92_018807 [Vanilla planifolia]KAG0468871.1 hypothetical protein HPP92_018199 [Vanilla planifolia]